MSRSIFLTAGAAALLAALTLAGCGARDSGVSSAEGRPPLYVAAAAPGNGNGTPARPFNSLAAVEQASAPGDTIIVMAAPENLPSLDGGIALKPGQKLLGQTGTAQGVPRITNSSSARLSGDAVVLAPGAEVAGLTIVKPYRGAIYGLNTPGVDIHGNDVSGHNTSCTLGLLIAPFIIPSSTPGIVVPEPHPLPNGWAGIMIDADTGTGSVSIHDNVVHDADCGDGIDLRMKGTADYQASIAGNTVSGLKQGPVYLGYLSVLAIGMQTLEQSRLAATLDRNTQHDIGDANQTTDSEGVFANLADASVLTAEVDHNTFTHGMGGFSANGMEMVISSGNASASMHISNSSFTDVPGDVLEEFNFGSNAVTRLVLDNVKAGHSVGAGLIQPLAGLVTQAGNLGDCLVMTSAAAGNIMTLTMRNSRLADCVHNGLSIDSNTSSGSGAARLISFDIDNSRIIANQGYNLRVLNLAPLDRLTGKLQNTDLSGSRGVDLGFENQGGPPGEVSLDFGGGDQGSVGGNCIFAGGTRDAETNGYSVSMKNNWWGSPGGPALARVSEQDGHLNYLPVLTAAPAACP